MSVPDRDEMARLRSEYTPMLLRTIAARMQMRVDAILERDRDERVAIEGRGAGISFLFARDIVHALEAGHDEIERQAARIATLEAALQRIAQWADAYPPSAFPPMTDAWAKRANAVLVDHGMTIDRISADAMRHVIEGVGKIAAAALADAPGERL